jgi:small subunit ribosomal protein S15
MERAIRLRRHMQNNNNDAQNKRALQNTEAKIRRLVSYHRGGELEEEFTYSYDVAVDLLEA